MINFYINQMTDSLVMHEQRDVYDDIFQRKEVPNEDEKIFALPDNLAVYMNRKVARLTSEKDPQKSL